MPVGQPTSSTPTYLGRILSCDPTQRLIDIQLNGGGQRVQVTTMPVAARWPVVGETWSVIFINNTPYLGEPYQAFNAGFTPIESVAAGDAFINSPTGVVHVLGGTSVTDFSFAKSQIPPPPPNTSGVYLAANGTGGSFWTGVSAGGGSSLVARAYRNATFILGTGWQKVPLDAVSFDPSGICDITTNHRINIPTAGYYLIDANVATLVDNTSQQSSIFVSRNGVIAAGNGGIEGSNYIIRGGALGDTMACTASGLIYCNAGDYLELNAFNTGPNTYNLALAEYQNYLSVAAVSSLPGVTGTTTVARAYRNASITMGATGWNKLPVDTASFDAAGRFDLVTNHRYNVPATGYYQVNAAARFAGVGDGTTTAVGIYLNGTLAITGVAEINGGAGDTASTAADIIFCNVGDYLELWVYASLIQTLYGGSGNNYLSVVQVGTSMNSTLLAQPAAKASLSASQSAALNTPLLIPFNTATWTQGGMTLDASGCFKVPTAGVYELTANALWDSINPTGRYDLLLINYTQQGGVGGGDGAAAIAGQILNHTNGQYGSSASLTGLIRCAANDLIGVVAMNRANVPANVYGNGNWTTMQAAKVSS